MTDHEFLAHGAQGVPGHELSSERMNAALHNFWRRAIPARSARCVQMIKNGMKNWPCTRYTGDFAHRRAVEISDPHAHGKLRCETDRPVIAKIGAGAGLARNRIGKTQGR